MNQETITMIRKEAERLLIINNLIAKIINGTDASKQLGLSVRQTKRLKAKVLKSGPEGIIHGSRNKKSKRKIDDKEIKRLLNERYHSFGPTLAAEKLKEIDNINTNKETVRQIMISEGLWKKKSRKRPEYFSFRERKASYGEMEQFDGSYHHWLPGIKEEQCLLVSVDDASGKITKAKFDRSEGIIPVFSFWKEYIEKHGKPLSIYLDRFSTYKVNHKNAEDNKELMTQFKRAAIELGIELITANTPQAKGRVERMNKTLQDRLVKELWLKGITNEREANRFLEEEFVPDFNKRFAVNPRSKANLHRKSDMDLGRVFSIKKERTIGNDYVIRFENKYYQLSEVQPVTVYKKSRVVVETRLDQSVKIRLRDKELAFTVLRERPKKEIDILLPALTKRKSGWKPPENHPWKNASFRRREAIINSQV